MKILITGSNGLLGQKLVQLILAKGEDELIATARGANRLPIPEEKYTYQSLDITNRADVLATIERFKPDAVVHTAAMTNVDQCETEQEACWKLNVGAVEYLIEACKNTGAYLLHLSTDFIFDGENGPYDEEGKPNPISYYGESKLAAEELLFKSSISYGIARTVLVYGIAHDMSRNNIILWVKKSLEDKKEIKVVDDQLRSPTLAEDLAMGCYLMAKQKAEGVFNISGKDVLTPYQMAIKTADFFNLDVSTMTKADASTFTQTAKRPPRTGLIIEKARTQLGYEPRSFDEGIAIVAEQIKA
ncbi:SDR family oxidoreductase [Roseivirga pacifica]|uniref:SDR family oxidoreductase n=1 Tax=Roseivirga pacifica TaxID=1267423 RepID=UPI002094310A|nr:SDR family oxidoreductase [Roseivirga pacifica]MCO6359637.1 sugar nucleotide-binding protein [Roseivirga pacifica]MCO6367007.1 sugar nucleotide-binding protein [Roseivirga pacifica]MCO6370461.1 sugar nucleotide-binding protein [Roseivirga pacifica]MCO6374664.1 sugar nucleotide-binding protein [Roseivirga pacifica]MCO6379922.1 sugar nucleotide-binding protein [Roseivirga pacifica]